MSRVRVHIYIYIYDRNLVFYYYNIDWHYYRIGLIKTFKISNIEIDKTHSYTYLSFWNKKIVSKIKRPKPDTIIYNHIVLAAGLVIIAV